MKSTIGFSSLLVASLFLQGCGDFVAQDLASEDSQNFVTIGDMRLERTRLMNANRSKAVSGKAQADVGYYVIAWRNGVYAVDFDPRISADKRAMFMEACRDWTAGTGLKCKAWEGEAEYVYITYDFNCSAFIGASSKPTRNGINLAPHCWDPATIRHEIGHSLGFIHEHQRADRDEFITVLKENIVEAGLPQFITIELLEGNYLNERYDFDSIMQYAKVNGYSRRSGGRYLPTMEAKPGFESLFKDELNTEISAMDRARMRQIYPQVAAVIPAPVATPMPTPTPAPTPAPTPVFITTSLPVAPVVVATPAPMATPAPSFPTATPSPTLFFGADRVYEPVHSVQIVEQNKILVLVNVSDPAGVVASIRWVQVSGPSIVTYDNQFYRYASIRNLTFGTYVMKLEAMNAAGQVVASGTTKLTLVAP